MRNEMLVIQNITYLYYYWKSMQLHFANVLYHSFSSATTSKLAKKGWQLCDVFWKMLAWLGCKQCLVSRQHYIQDFNVLLRIISKSSCIFFFLYPGERKRESAETWNKKHGIRINENHFRIRCWCCWFSGYLSVTRTEKHGNNPEYRIQELTQCLM